MANIRFINSRMKSFGEIDKGDYFEYDNQLFVKCHLHKDENFNHCVNELGRDEKDYTYNAFSLASDEFVYFDNDTIVVLVFYEDITIIVSEE